MRAVFLLIIPCILTIDVHERRILGQRCDTHANCTDLVSNSACSSKVCVCQVGFRSKGPLRCVIGTSKIRRRRQSNYGVKMLGDDCQRTDECRRTLVDRTRVCLSYKCQCARGYFPIDPYRCIRDAGVMPSNARAPKTSGIEPLGYGSACLTNSDCQQITNQLQCFREACMCPAGHVPLGKYLCYSVYGQSSTVTESPPMSSSPPMRLTATRYVIHREVIKPLGKIDEPCTTDYFCRRAVFQSHCFNGKCACVEGYMAMDLYSCVRRMDEETTPLTLFVPSRAEQKSLLGGPCSTRRNCRTPVAICQYSICSCPQGYFPIDSWTCLSEPESSDETFIQTTYWQTSTTTTTTTTTEETTTTEIPSTTVFRWWPWSPSSSTRQSALDMKNTFRARCLLNRQCASMDRNSHCTLIGRCICNRGFQLETTDQGQGCIQRSITDEDCD